MRIYELTVILNPNLDKEQISTEIDKLTGMVESSGGKVLEVQHLGLRRISFEMKGCSQGSYHTIYFNSSPDLLPEMDKSMKLNESILRSLTIVLKPSEYIPPEVRKEKVKSIPADVDINHDENSDEGYEDDMKEEL